MAKQKNNSLKNLAKNLVMALLLMLVISGLFGLFSGYRQGSQEISLSELAQAIEAGQVQKIAVKENQLDVLFTDGTQVVSQKEAEASLIESLRNYGVSPEKIQALDIKIASSSKTMFWLGTVLSALLPILLFGALLYFMLRSAQKGQMKALSFGQSQAKIYSEKDSKNRVTFKDVADLKEAKEELQEVVDFLRNPKKYINMGAKIPRGVLLVGPPGCGKTLLARAVASEARVPFFHISGSEFIELFVGVGASITGDTPVLIRTRRGTQLIPIAEFVDQFYQGGNKRGVIPVTGVKTLGYSPLKTNVWGASGRSKTKFFGHPSWQEVKGVYRHKVKEIYEIHYLGGKLQTTGDHSVFVRHRNFIKAKKVSKLKPGDILVNLPFKVRAGLAPGIGTIHKVKTHIFSQKSPIKELVVWEGKSRWQWAYEFALANRDVMYQYEIAKITGIHKDTIGSWQRMETCPKYTTATRIPEKVKVTKGLMKLFGLYTAEGKGYPNLLFTFGAQEKEAPAECIKLMKKIFHLDPKVEFTQDNSLRLYYYSAPLGRFFAKHCGNGSHNKHIPEFLWDMPRKYFLSYLEGYSQGDGYTTQEGKLSITSVSLRLIQELAWLCGMHGIQVGIRQGENKPGRIIKRKPLPGGKYWNLIIDTTSHPFSKEKIKYPQQFKKPVVRKIIKKPYNGYVYDLCGCGNEAFFGGQKPILLHNSRVRSAFQMAKKNAPSILFIDELDAIGRVRGAGLGGGHDEREQTLNQILTEMDGFDKETNCIILSATNRPDILDPALLRPGRFDRKVILDLPDIKARQAILKVHARGKPLARSVSLKEIAERTPGFSGADLENLLNEAAILAAKKNRRVISKKDLLESIEKVMLGREKKSRVMSEKEKKISAFHEAGHALVAHLLPHTDPIRKISIVSRGMAGGYTLKVPEKDKYFYSQSEFLDELASLLGGYAAEKIVFGETTTGAANDLKNASSLARDIVTRYGMSASLGPVTFGEREELIFLGKELAQHRNYSDKTAFLIDKEIQKLLKTAYQKAKKILLDKKALLEKIAQALIKKETLERTEFEKLVGTPKLAPVANL